MVAVVGRTQQCKGLTAAIAVMYCAVDLSQWQANTCLGYEEPPSRTVDNEGMTQTCLERRASLCGKMEYTVTYVRAIIMLGRTRRSTMAPRAAKGKAASSAFGSAVVKYQCAGCTPHSELLHGAIVGLE